MKGILKAAVKAKNYKKEKYDDIVDIRPPEVVRKDKATYGKPISEIHHYFKEVK